MIECKFTKKELEMIYEEMHVWFNEETYKLVEKIKRLIEIAELNEEIEKLEKENE